MESAYTPALLEAAEAAMWAQWADAAAAGHTMKPEAYLLGSAHLCRGPAVAFCFAGLRRERLLNRAVGCDDSPQTAAALLEFLQGRNIPPALDLLPDQAAVLGEWLRQQGLRPLMALSVLARTLAPGGNRRGPAGNSGAAEGSKASPLPGQGAGQARYPGPGGPPSRPASGSRRSSLGLPRGPAMPPPPAPLFHRPPAGSAPAPPGSGPVRPHSSARFPGPRPEREAGREAAPANRIRVEAVTRRQATVFAATYAAGFGVATAEAPLHQALAAAVVGRPGWGAYLAWLEGEPAGAALLFLQGAVAILAGCGVRPHLRRRGVQAALVRCRLDAATAAGCRVAATQTGVGSPSERNMLRLGFSLAYRKTVWGR